MDVSLPTVRDEKSVFDVVSAPWLVQERDNGIVVLALAYILGVAALVTRKDWAWAACVLPPLLSALNRFLNHVCRQSDIQSVKNKCLSVASSSEMDIAVYIQVGGAFNIDTKNLAAYRDDDAFKSACKALRKFAGRKDFTEGDCTTIQGHFVTLNIGAQPVVQKIKRKAETKVREAKRIYDETEIMRKKVCGIGLFRDLFVHKSLQWYTAWDDELSQVNRLSRQIIAMTKSSKFVSTDVDWLLLAKSIVAEAEELQRLTGSLIQKMMEETQFQQQVCEIFKAEAGLYRSDAQRLRDLLKPQSQELNGYIDKLSGLMQDLTIDKIGALRAEFRTVHSLFQSLVEKKENKIKQTMQAFNNRARLDAKRKVAQQQRPVVVVAPRRSGGLGTANGVEVTQPVVIVQRRAAPVWIDFQGHTFKRRFISGYSTTY